MQNLFKSWVSKNEIKKEELKNMFLLLIRYTLLLCGATFMSNSLLQAYLLNVGVDKIQIGTIISVANISQSLCYFAFMGISDKIKKTIRLITISSLCYVSLPLIIFILCLAKIKSPTLIFAAVMLGMIVNYSAAAIRNIIETKILLNLISLKACGSYTGVSGIISSFATVLAGIFSVLIVQGLVFPWNLALIFALSALLFLAFALLSMKLKLISKIEAKEDNPLSPSPLAALKTVVRSGNFALFAAPNLLRGIIMGAGAFVVPIGAMRLSLTPLHASYIVASDTLAAIATNIIFTLLINKTGAGKLCVIGPIAGAIGFAILFSTNSVIIYIGATFLIMFGLVMFDQAVPIGIYEIIPGEKLGSFTAIRFLLMTCGTALSTFLLGAVLGRLSMLAIGGVLVLLQLTSGYLYHNLFLRSASLESDRYDSQSF